MHRPSPPRLPRLLSARLAVPLLLLSACVSEKLPAVDEGGHSLWQRVETEHFVLESNIPHADGVRGVAGDFETLWHAFASVPILGRKPPADKPIIVLLDSVGEYRYFAGSLTDGLFYSDTLLGPLILLPPNSGLFQDVVVKHELAHFMCSDFLRDAPMWLHEGLATVMETASYDTDEGRIRFGDLLRGRVDAAATRLPASVFMAEWPDQTTTELYAYYARSWLLVHYLIDEHLKEFGDFLVRVSHGDDWKVAWSGVMPLRLDDVDEALDRYYDRGKYGLWTVKARLPDMDAFRQSTPSVADTFALRSVLQAYATNPRRAASRMEDARNDLEVASTLEPQNARVQKILAASEAPR